MTSAWTQLEKRSADVVTEEKVDRINRALDEQKRALDELTLAAARPIIGGERKAGAVSRRASARPRSTAMSARAMPAGFDALELKALSVGSDPDGGYTVPLEIESTIDRVLAKASPIRAIATVRQIGANVYRKPITTAGAATRLGRRNRRASAQTNTPTLAALDFPAMELYAMPAATQTLLDDSAGRYRAMAGRRSADRLRRTGRRRLRHRRRLQQADRLPALHHGRGRVVELGQSRLHRQRRGWRVRVDQSRRCAHQSRLCAEAGLSRQRHAG